MPRSQPVVLALDRVQIRHIGPASAIWPGVASPIAPSAAVLGQTLYARVLPTDNVPADRGWDALTYTTRLDDSGEAAFTAPNTAASDGLLWRARVSPTGRLQWFEVSVGGEIEGVYCVDTVAVDDGLGFSSTQDATDFCSSLQGNGAGFQNGTTGQLQALVFDPATMLASLFDAQGWQDFSDASFPSLLQALLNAQLALRLTPWQLLAVDPAGGGGGAVVVHGQDGMFCLKGAYERDWTVVQAPRDVIERSTQVWVPLAADSFPAGALSGQWNAVQTNGGTVAVGSSGGVILSVPANPTSSNNVTLSPGTGADVGGGTLTWFNPGKVTRSDGQFANATNTDPRIAATSNTLRATGFGFSVPGGATIVGVQVSIRREGQGFVQDNSIQLVKGGAGTGTPKAGGGWPASDTSASYGGAADMWGATLAPADVNAANFGVQLSATVGPNSTALVDFAQITVYYTFSGPNPVAAIQSQTTTVTATGVWKASSTIQTSSLNGLDGCSLTVTESSGDAYALAFFGATAVTTLLLNGSAVAVATPGTSPSYSLLLESDGEWVSGYLNGQLIGATAIRRAHSSTTSVQAEIEIASSASGQSATATVVSALVECQQPFLMAGSDKGDYVLPGVASTYPNGGLHARYFNNTDLQGDANRLSKIHSPPRTQAYSGGGTAEYQNQQDTNIAAQANPTPGAATSHWSAIWFGSIYLKLSAGNYSFQIILPAVANNQAVRVWIGKTQFGTQLVDQWAYTNTSGQTYSFTVTAAALAGTLPYGAGTVQRDGWYPIKIEYAVDGTAAAAPQFVIASAPGSYTDPGGGQFSTTQYQPPGGFVHNFPTVFPATSLSPLGCVDQRYQGLAHFDLAQQTIQAYGYQASLEPKQLESGLFPGVLAPRIREGADYDPILVPDKTIAQDGQLLLRPQQANTWPLPGSIGNLRWRPGDGIRVQDRDINVWDTATRQILTLTRNLLPGGIASTLASFANRPVTQAKILKQQLYTATRLQRNKQRQLVTLTGSYQALTLAANTQTTSALAQNSFVSLQPGDQIVRAWVRVNFNNGSVAFRLIVNGADQTAPLNGPWTVVPLVLEITAVAAPDAFSQLWIGLKNASLTTSSQFNWQVLVDVLR